MDLNSALLLTALGALAVAYLAHVNSILKGVPDEVKSFLNTPWTPEQLKSTYREIEKKPLDYTEKLPRKQDRRYIVTGGNGESRTATSEMLKMTDFERSCRRPYSPSIGG